MKLLLDTHSFLWFIEDDSRLSTTARTLIEDGDNEVFLSVGSLWEMAIKVSLGKLRLSQPFATFIPDQLAANTISPLPIAVDHAAQVVTLPFHHRDPFDRLLIAQALIDHIPIVGVDTVFDLYGVKRIW
jgi:PIN domain nuclease of toxin-antitoxin system